MRWAEWLVFPVVMFGAIALMIGLMANGMAPALAVIVTDAAAFAVVITAERLMPHRPDWNRSHGDLGADVGHALVSGVVGLQLTKRTFFLPERDPPAAIGIADLPRFPRGYLAQLGSPFRSTRVRRDAAAPAVA